MSKFWSEREGDAILAGDPRCVEEKKFVDDARSERRSVHRRACFEKDPEDIAATEFHKYIFPMDAAVLRSGVDDFDTLFPHQPRPFRTYSLIGENKEVVLGCFHDTRVPREGQFAVENDTQ